MKLSHLDKEGRASMVDVSEKDVTKRVAKAAGYIHINPEVIEAIKSGSIPKGDVLATARIAGMQAAKKTGELIPLCHPLPIDHIGIEFEIDEAGISITASVTSTGRTGVEMEALTAVAAASLTIYDICKAADKTMKIDGIRLLEKSGGRSGKFVRNESTATAKIIATCISENKGTIKENVGKINMVENLGVEGDAHAAPGKRQVSIIGIGTIEKMKEKGIDVSPGSFGENLTVEGIIPHKIPVGTSLKIGDVLLEVTQIGKECHHGCEIRRQVGDCPMPREGIFAAVIRGGEVSVGATLEVL